MTAYVIFGLQAVSDGEGLKQYRATGIPTLVAHGARVVAGPNVAATLEGEPLKGAVVVAFDTVAAARTWYESPEYQAAAGIRHAASTGFGFIVEGRD